MSQTHLLPAAPFSQAVSARLATPPPSSNAVPPASPKPMPSWNQHVYDTLSFLSVKRLESVASYFWLAGRPNVDPLQKAPLHRLKATGFTFVIFEDASLHLLWEDMRMFIKPLPRCLMDFDFWEQNLALSDAGHDAGHMDIVHGALGLLLSYAWLVRWESDLKMAQEIGVLSKDIEYEAWMAFTSSVLSTFKRSQISKPWLSWRYDFAEMRLQRINLIWRLRPRWPFDMVSLLRGYNTRYRVYTSFFERNFGIALVVFIYVTVVLTAMQLGLATDQLQNNERFEQASLGFAVFCILLPLIFVCVAFVIFVILFIFNMVATRKHLNDTKRDASSAAKR